MNSLLRWNSSYHGWNLSGRSSEATTPQIGSFSRGRWEETRNDCWQKSDRPSKTHRGSASDRPGREDFKASQNYLCCLLRR